MISATAVVTCFIFLLLKEIMFPEETIIPKERNIPVQRIDNNILVFLDIDKNPYEDYELPEEFTEWIAQSLEDGDWDKKLKEISAEYKELNASEKRQYFTE